MSKQVRRGGWTSAQRKKLSAIRAPHSADPGDFVLSREAAWKDLVARKAAEGDPPATLDPEVERARLGKLVHLFGGQGIKGIHQDFTMPLIGFWVGTVGLKATYSLFYPDVNEPAKDPLGRMTYLTWHLMPSLRRYTFAAPEADYEAARSMMEPVFQALETTSDWELRKQRDWLAYLFSRDPVWASALAKREIETDAKNYVVCEAPPIFAALTVPELSLAFAQRRARGVVTTDLWAYDIVESLGMAAGPVLKVLIAAASSARDKKPFQAALAVVTKLEEIGGDAPAADEGAKASAADAPQKSAAQKSAAQKNAAQKNAAQKNAAQKNAAQKSALDDTPGAPSAEAAGATSDLPASLLDPWAAARASQAAAPKKPKKLAPPADVLVIDVDDERRQRVAEAEAKKTYGDEAEKRKAIDAQVARPKLYLWYALRAVTEELSPEARLRWLDALSERDWKEVTKDRNGLSPDQLLDGFILPLHEAHPERAADWLRIIHALKAEYFLEIARFVRSPSMALRAAEIASGKKSADGAGAWLVAHPALAIEALVPAVVNAGGDKQAAYVAALERLRAAGHGDAIRAALDAHGVRVYVETLLGAGDAPLERPKSMPALWVPGELPPLVRHDGRPLPADVVDEVGRMMKASPAGAPMPGLVDLVTLTTAESRARFAWSLVEAWLALGAPPQERWPLEHAAVLAGDAIVERIATELVRWAEQGQHARAFWGVDVLQRHATDPAAWALFRIGGASQFDGLRGRCRDALEHIATARALTLDELYDELVPSLGLTLGTPVVLDYGARTFDVRIAPGLALEVREDGALQKELPKPRKSDDASLAAEARARFSTLKRELTAVAKQQVARMEQAMVDQRRWGPARFRAVLLEHPVMIHLAEGLLWGVYGAAGELERTFRVDESRGLADVSDTAMALPEEGAIGLVHPIELDPLLRDRWTEVFADYEILQPFEQLARATFDASAVAAAVAKMAGATLSSGALRGLRRRGWTRGPAEDAGLVHSMVRTVRADEGEKHMVLRFDPGLSVGGPDTFDNQTLLGLDLEDPARLPAVAASELVLDLQSLGVA